MLAACVCVPPSKICVYVRTLGHRHSAWLGGLDGWEVMLCLMCVRRFVCLLVGHPCPCPCLVVLCHIIDYVCVFRFLRFVWFQPPTCRWLIFGDDTYAFDHGTSLYDAIAFKEVECRYLGHIDKLEKQVAFSLSSTRSFESDPHRW